MQILAFAAIDLVEPITRAVISRLQELGHEVTYVGVGDTIAAAPDLLFSMNFRPDVAQMARESRTPYLCWMSTCMVDEAMYAPEAISEYVIMAHCARNDLLKCRLAGFPNLLYLPRPLNIEAYPRGVAVRNQRIHNTAFVGNFYHRSNCLFESYQSQCEAAGQSDNPAVLLLAEFIETAAEKQLVMPMLELLISQIKHQLPDFWNQLPLPQIVLGQGGQREIGKIIRYIDQIIGHDIDFRVRRCMLQEMARFGIAVWAQRHQDVDLEQPGVFYQGYAQGQTAVLQALATAKLGINLPRRFSDGPIFRHYELALAGTCQLAVANDDVAAMFEPDREIVFFHSWEEAADKAAYYLEHDQQRERIAAAAYQRLIRDHTISRRLDLLRNELHHFGIRL